MHKTTSIRLDLDLKDYMLSFGAEYGFCSLGALVNGVIYYSMYQTNPENFDVRQLLEDILDGKLTTQDTTSRRIAEKESLQELKLFYAYMDQEWGNEMLANIINRGLSYYLYRSAWVENVRLEFCKLYDIPLLPWETKKYIRYWYERAEQTGRLRNISRRQLLGETLTQQTHLEIPSAEHPKQTDGELVK